MNNKKIIFGILGLVMVLSSLSFAAPPTVNILWNSRSWTWSYLDNPQLSLTYSVYDDIDNAVSCHLYVNNVLRNDAAINNPVSFAGPSLYFGSIGQYMYLPIHVETAYKAFVACTDSDGETGFSQTIDFRTP